MITPKLVYLTAENPFYAGRKGKARELSLLELLTSECEVNILCVAPRNAAEAEIAPIPPRAKVHEIARVGRFWSRIWYGLWPRFWSRKPRLDQVARRLQKLYAPNSLLWIASPSLRRYAPIARTLGYCVLADVPPQAQAPKVIRRRRQHPDFWITSTERDHEWYVKRFGAPHVFHVPTAISTERYQAFAAQEMGHKEPTEVTLFFGGALNSESNQEGLLWFSQHVIPRLKAHYGHGMPRILVAGRYPAERLRAELDSRGVQIIANPTDLGDLLGEVEIVIFPVRRSGGAARRVLEAMAAGRAVVATPQAIHGLVLAPFHDIWIADGADRFASALIRLIGDTDARRALGQAAARTARERYDRSLAHGRLLELIAQTLAFRG